MANVSHNVFWLSFLELWNKLQPTEEGNEALWLRSVCLGTGCWGWCKKRWELLTMYSPSVPWSLSNGWNECVLRIVFAMAYKKRYRTEQIQWSKWQDSKLRTAYHSKAILFNCCAGSSAQIYQQKWQKCVLC